MTQRVLGALVLAAALTACGARTDRAAPPATTATVVEDPTAGIQPSQVMQTETPAADNGVVTPTPTP